MHEHVRALPCMRFLPGFTSNMESLVSMGVFGEDGKVVNRFESLGV